MDRRVERERERKRDTERNRHTNQNQEAYFLMILSRTNINTLSK